MDKLTDEMLDGRDMPTPCSIQFRGFFSYSTAALERTSSRTEQQRH